MHSHISCQTIIDVLSAVVVLRLLKIWQEGTTPLVLAAANNHLECVKELLKNGADPSARRLVSNVDYSFSYGYSCLS